jgi:hypothetical protein
MSVAQVEAWPAELRGPVDAVLDRVDNALLSAGVTRPARHTAVEAIAEEIVRDVHIRSGEAAPTRPSVDAAVAQVAGLPMAGISGSEWRRHLTSIGPRRSRCGFWGALLVIVSLLPLAVVLMVASFFSPGGIRLEADFPRDAVHAEVGAPVMGHVENADVTLFRATAPDGMVRASAAASSEPQRFLWLFLPVSPFAVAGTLLGLLAVADILLSRGKVVGLPTALFALLFYPLMLAGIFTLL